MIYDDYLIARKKEILEKLSVIDRELLKAPKGYLIISVYRGKPHYYMKIENNSTNKVQKKYLSKKKDYKLIKALAQKRHNLFIKERLQNELKAINAYLSIRDKWISSIDNTYNESEYIRNLLCVDDNNYSDYVTDWLNKPYEKNPYHPEKLKIPTNSSVLVRSKSEALIFNRLLESGLPFIYEKPINIGGQVIYPDFTILNPSTGKIYIYEHFGMLDDEEYFDKFIRKLAMYKNNEYIVGNNFFMTYETDNIPFDVREVNRIIDVIKNDIEEIYPGTVEESKK